MNAMPAGGETDLASAVTLWAHGEPSVRAAVMVGSRLRPGSDAAAADMDSDWDFQLVVRRPAAFLNPRWLEDAALGQIVAFAARKPLWEGGYKINVALADREVDFMIFPAATFARLKWLAKTGLVGRSRRAMHLLQTIIHVVRPSWRFLKGGDWLGPLYDFANASIPDPRLSDADAQRIAAGFYCDYRWAIRKIRRGELLAAQRMLHMELAEANFRLLHELKLRRGERSFERARRIERLAAPGELAAVTVSAGCEAEALKSAVEHAASTCSRLVRELTGVNVLTRCAAS